MRVANAYALIWLWFVCAAIVFAVWASRVRRQKLKCFAREGVLPELTATVDESRIVLKTILRISVMFFLVIALVRPQWGFEWQTLTRKGVDILIAVDVSKSMLATDIKPNRLERTKLAIKDLVSKLGGDRIGLIAFAGTAFVQCPLTSDYSGFLVSLNDLSTDTIPRGGTSISALIKEALKSYEGGEKKYKVLVIVTDGEELEGSAMGMIDEVKNAGIRIYAVGIGTPDGDLIPIVDEKGDRVYLKDRDGSVVKTRLNEKLLQDLALQTSGSYVRAGGADFGLELMYEKKIATLEERELQSKMARRYEERFQIFLLIAFVLLCVDLVLSRYKKETKKNHGT